MLSWRNPHHVSGSSQPSPKTTGTTAQTTPDFLKARTNYPSQHPGSPVPLRTQSTYSTSTLSDEDLKRKSVLLPDLIAQAREHSTSPTSRLVSRDLEAKIAQFLLEIHRTEADELRRRAGVDAFGLQRPVSIGPEVGQMLGSSGITSVYADITSVIPGSKSAMSLSPAAALLRRASAAPTTISAVTMSKPAETMSVKPTLTSTTPLSPPTMSVKPTFTSTTPLSPPAPVPLTPMGPPPPAPEQSHTSVSAGSGSGSKQRGFALPDALPPSSTESMKHEHERQPKHPIHSDIVKPASFPTPPTKSLPTLASVPPRRSSRHALRGKRVTSEKRASTESFSLDDHSGSTSGAPSTSNPAAYPAPARHPSHPSSSFPRHSIRSRSKKASRRAVKRRAAKPLPSIPTRTSSQHEPPPRTGTEVHVREVPVFSVMLGSESFGQAQTHEHGWGQSAEVAEVTLTDVMDELMEGWVDEDTPKVDRKEGNDDGARPVNVNVGIAAQPRAPVPPQISVEIVPVLEYRPRSPPPPPPRLRSRQPTVLMHLEADDHATSLASSRSFGSQASWSTATSPGTSRSASPVPSLPSVGNPPARFKVARPGEARRVRRSTKKRPGGPAAAGEVEAKPLGKVRRFKSLVGTWTNMKGGKGVMGELKDKLASKGGK
ncbi:hypothetical protein M427DRAFT_51618 [Gonapodya prolifera JEL478]|uniref:Uncharacterized protein n=1 Tax=Gonapodya prolifera (strain JEL478) TaxID=1344416 RepID=A0A139AXC9_GONPJ|nr:hypothetical protein M427DRAFT_51618 [Gonapodya prolifera JEL478]|eukprot:KXS21402.1 hypothetical protein M427DRAFT_51618 [Gonapodya prolifera JEL478]